MSSDFSKFLASVSIAFCGFAIADCRFLFSCLFIVARHFFSGFDSDLNFANGVPQSFNVVAHGRTHHSHIYYELFNNLFVLSHGYPLERKSSHFHISWCLSCELSASLKPIYSLRYMERRGSSIKIPFSVLEIRSASL